ncbi:M14 family zinc carboxypeptidase [Roseivivax sp. CAU 1753]
MPYMNITEVQSATQALATAYPGTCELITLPNQTHEGRDVYGLRLGLGALDSRPGIAFIGGQHAREWGSCEICVNFAADLLEAYSLNTGLSYGGQSYSATTVKRLIEDAQIFVLPMVNPDGRHYSQTSFAMWRKNRNPGGAVDLNRNYDVLWDFNTTMHPSTNLWVSDSPASDMYHGTAPFSEPETQNVKWLFDTYPQIRWAVDIHSFSELLYHVWGHDQNQVEHPAQNFTNASFDGQRGLKDDTTYAEYIPAADLGTQCGLVQAMQTALFNVRGITYTTGQSFELYATTGTLSDYPYSRHIANPALTKTHGFLIEWGTDFQPGWAEMENIILDVSSALVAFADTALDDCNVLNITLQTPSLQFIDVPETETTSRAVTFHVQSCCKMDFEIVSGPTVSSGPAGTAFGTPLGTSDAAPAAPGSYSSAHLWVSYTGTAAGDTATGEITVRCRQTRQEWVVPITTNVIARPTAAALLVFDQSNSMSFASGIGAGITRGDVLKFSAPPVVDIIEDTNALGILRFDHDTHDTMPITDIDLSARNLANGHIAGYGHNPNGWTSIGEAVDRGQQLLGAPSITQDVKAMIVLTDGRENHGPHTRQSISDVAGSITDRVYAIGLGEPGALDPSALQSLCNGHQGYMLITGALDTDALFKLTKYYQQILAGVTNNEIVVDPEGYALPGHRHEIPVKLSETDISVDFMLLSPLPQVFRFSLITPTGAVVDYGTAATDPAIELGGGKQLRFYRMTLPLALKDTPSHGGTWKAVVEIDEKLYDRYVRKHNDDVYAPGSGPSSTAHGVRYAVMARAWSNLRMAVQSSQTGFEPGAEQHLQARLTEFGVPVDNRASVWAAVEGPTGAKSVVSFTETAPGVFDATLPLAQVGVHTSQVMASGKTFRGTEFTRELIVTGAVWDGGDRPPPGGGTPADANDKPGLDLCCLLECLLGMEGVQKLLKENGIPPEDFKQCLERCCRDMTTGKPPTVAGIEALVRDATNRLAKGLGIASGTQAKPGDDGCAQ